MVKCILKLLKTIEQSHISFLYLVHEMTVMCTCLSGRVHLTFTSFSSVLNNIQFFVVRSVFSKQQSEYKYCLKIIKNFLNDKWDITDLNTFL